jgi:DNA-binding MarR family transcriptional regulator
MRQPANAKSVAIVNPPTNLREVLTYRLPMAELLLNKVTSPIYSRVGLTVYQWKVLAAIASFGPAPAVEIARRATVDKAVVSRSVRQLMDKKLVKRILGDDDRPVIRILLTSAGQAIFSGVVADLQKLQSRLLRGLDDASRTCFFEALMTIEDNLREVQKLPARQA